jgi:DNA gyrase subunit B
MYVGDTSDGTGLHAMIWALVDNVVSEHLSRHATELHVEIASDSSVTVRDDGSGIPVDIVRQTGVSALEWVFTRLSPGGGRYLGHVGHVGRTSGSPGLAAVNALCERLDVETTRSGIRWAQSYRRGEPQSPPRCLGASAIEGTMIRFRADPHIFGHADFDRDRVGARLQELAWLNPWLRVFFQERRLRGTGGLAGWVGERLDPHAGPWFDTSQASNGVHVDLALGWGSPHDAVIRCFVNMEEDAASSAPIAGIWQGCSDWAATLGAEVRGADQVRDALAPGLVAIVHVGLRTSRCGGRPGAEHLEMAAAEVSRAVASGLPVATWEYAGLRSFLDARLRVPRDRR